MSNQDHKRLLPEGTTIHQCRSWCHLFQPILDGVKTHDLRRNDRGYKVGDIINLLEYDPALGELTGRACPVEITYITGRGLGHSPCAFSSAILLPEYVILSIKRI